MDFEVKTEPPEEDEINLNTSKMLYQCDECEEEFADKPVLELHKSLHDTSKTCGICKKQFREMQSFFNHINKHISEICRCSLCPDIFFVKKEYHAHVAKHQNAKSSNQYQCETCQKSFKIKKCLKVHMRVHTNERPYACDICSKTFKQMNSLTTHKYTHSDSKQHKCDLCDGTFSTPSAVRRHIRNIHSKGRLINCSLCKKPFQSKDAMLKHQKIDHADEVFECQICQSTCATQEALTKHLQRMHKLQKSFPCPEKSCQRSFFNEQELYAHQAADHSEVTYNLSDDSDINEDLPSHNLSKIGSASKSCPLCGEEFPFNSTYFRHKQTHEGPTVCGVCRELIEGQDIFNHELIHLKMSKEEYNTCVVTGIFPCKYCDHIEHKGLIPIKKHIRNHYVNLRTCNVCHESFTYVISFYRHKYNKHKVIECAICKRSFVGYQKYVKHRETEHLNVKHECDTCSRIFSNYKAWRRHKYDWHQVVQCFLCNVKFRGYKSYVQHRVKVHLSLLPKPYKCTVCNKQFLFKNLLRKHFKCHTKRVRFYTCVDCNYTKFFKKNIEEHLQSSPKCTSQKFRSTYSTNNTDSNVNTKAVKNMIFKIEHKPHSDKHLSILKKTNDKKYRFKCKNCPALFRFFWNWRKHVHLKVCLKPSDQDLNDFNCVVCHAVHEDMQSLVQHMMKHTYYRKVPLKRERKIHEKRKNKNNSSLAKSDLMEKDTVKTEVWIKEEVDPEL